LLVVLRHEKHPKGWTGVQLLGCSSSVRPFYFPFSFSRAAGYARLILITRKRQARQGFEAWLFSVERLSFGF
ncbi:hypothetical protein, partial [Burkholderia ambifaria]|uniref:hypothetical protein n=1 Tax=Burkholderia ambifaria TaxID=152480 RepID=UPI002FDF9CCB